MNTLLLIPLVWVVIGILTWVSWRRHTTKYPKAPLTVSPTDSDNIYTRYEQYNRYDNTQYDWSNND